MFIMFSLLFQLYFIDHSSRTTTFIDPRLPVEETLPRRNRSETEVRFFNQLIACRSRVLLQRDRFVNNIHPLARCLNRSQKTVSFQEQIISQWNLSQILCLLSLVYFLPHGVFQIWIPLDQPILSGHVQSRDVLRPIACERICKMDYNFYCIPASF